MQFPPEDFRLLHFCSDDFPPEQRLAGWRDILNRTLLKFDVEPLAEPFYVDAVLRILPEIRFGAALCGPCISRRTAAIVASDRCGFYFVINLEGLLEVSAEGSQVTLGERDAVFLSCAQQAQFVRQSPGRLLCLRCEPAGLEAILPRPAAYCGRVFRRGNEALRFFTTYLREIDGNQTFITAELRKLVILQIYSLLALVLKSSQGIELAAQRADIAAMRLRAVKGYVAGNFIDPRLDLDSVARATSMSQRQIQRLFEADETTFSQFVSVSRLQAAHSALIDRLQIHRSISDIALESGFGDISSFNRAFRNHFGAAPGAIRKAAILEVLSAN